MDSAHAPWPQESKVENILLYNICRAQEGVPSPRVHQAPTKTPSSLHSSHLFSSLLRVTVQTLKSSSEKAPGSRS